VGPAPTTEVASRDLAKVQPETFLIVKVYVALLCETGRSGFRSTNWSYWRDLGNAHAQSRSELDKRIAAQDFEMKSGEAGLHFRCVVTVLLADYLSSGVNAPVQVRAAYVPCFVRFSIDRFGVECAWGIQFKAVIVLENVNSDEDLAPGMDSFVLKYFRAQCLPFGSCPRYEARCRK